MLRVALAARAVSRGVASASPVAAVCGGFSCGDMLQTRSITTWTNQKTTNKVPKISKQRNPPSFGFVAESDIAKNHKYIDWNTLHPSRLQATVRQASQAPLYSDDELTIRRMFQCGVHYGHDVSMWHPLISQFLYGHRNGMHIFNLEETLKCLRVALTFVRGVAQRGGIILFVNTRPQFETIVRTAAIEAGEYYVTQRWVPGIITNRLRAFEQDVKPDAVVFLSMPVNAVAIRETESGQVPSIGICDSDCDPTKVMYPIPGNDDGIDPMRLYLSLFKAAILDGKKNPIAPPATKNFGGPSDMRRRN